MPDPLTFSAITVTVYTRHKRTCPLKNEPLTKKCECPKWLYTYANGKGHRKSSKSASWKKAEEMVVAERERLRTGDLAPVKGVTVVSALEQWLASFKGERSLSTTETYKLYTDKIARWATDNGIELLKDVTRTQLSQWRGAWGKAPFLPDGSPRRLDDRIGATTQSQFLGYLKRFFFWAEGDGLLPEDPARHLSGIKSEGAKTVPLDQEQFKQVMSAVERLRNWGTELKAIFLVQRWTGLRIIDVLMLRRDALIANRLSLTVKKTKKQASPILPPHVIEALEAVRPQAAVHPDFFFWDPARDLENLETQWLARIGRLNKDLNLVYPRQHAKAGQPMRLKSHMLRDTFAVEMLLARVPLEKVSRLLGHKSIRVTEIYYAHWTEDRLKQLDEDVHAAFRKMGVA